MQYKGNLTFKTVEEHIEPASVEGLGHIKGHHDGVGALSEEVGDGLHD